MSDQSNQELKSRRFVATVEFEVTWDGIPFNEEEDDIFHGDEDIYQDEDFVSNMTNELVKVKSGIYENRLYGNILEIKEIK